MIFYFLYLYSLRSKFVKNPRKRSYISTTHFFGGEENFHVCGKVVLHNFNAWGRQNHHGVFEDKWYSPK